MKDYLIIPSFTTDEGVSQTSIFHIATFLNRMPNHFIFVENYLEAVGVITAMKEGIGLFSVRRPVNPTKVLTN